MALKCLYRKPYYDYYYYYYHYYYYYYHYYHHYYYYYCLILPEVVAQKTQRPEQDVLRKMLMP